MRTFIAIGMIGLAGCASSGTKVSPEQMSGFQVGKTTEAQVIAALGVPNSSATASDGSKSDVYIHVKAHANAVNYIPVVGLLAGGAKSESDTVVFAFNRDGVLTETARGSAHADVKTGLLNQN